jgi:CRISPR-associated protein (TIGR02710 family)
MNEVSPRSALLITVGGTPNPIAYSIEHHRPGKVIFFASADSRTEIEAKVRPLVTHWWRDSEIITTPDPQHLTKCIEVLSRELPDKLKVLGLDWRDLIVDYTGGTKTMSAALALATISQPVAYSYVGGTVRTKEGLGVVLDGSEAVVINPNPWDALALELKRRMARQFNQASFAEARHTAEEAMARVSPDRRVYFEDFRNLFDAYLRWSLFDYPKAKGPLHRALEGLRRVGDPSLADFLEQVGRDAERLDRIVDASHALQSGKAPEAEAVRALLIDLVTNAVRTVRLANRPDDGVARLYSAIEKLAKAALQVRGINNSSASPEQIPEALREEYSRRFLDSEDEGVLRFGLDASYRLLAALQEPLGAAYLRRERELSQLLGARNGSLMVHGWSPVKTDVFDRMLGIALDFLGMEQGELPTLPFLPFDQG